MSVRDMPENPYWAHLNKRCGDGCPYCTIAQQEKRIEELEARDSANKAMAVSQNNAITELYTQLQLSAEELEAETASHTKTITDRDHWESKSTELADDVGELLGFDVGEHSSANCPVQNAIDGVFEMSVAFSLQKQQHEAEITVLKSKLELSTGVIERQALLIQEFIEGVAAHEAKRQQRVHVRLGGTYHKALASFDTPDVGEKK